MFCQKKKFNNMLAIITNGLKTNKFSVNIPIFRYALPFLNILRFEGLIYGYSVKNNTVLVYLKYYQGRPVFNGFKTFVSKRGIKYLKVKDLKINGIYSTSLGILMGAACISKNVGGELLTEWY